LIPAQTVLAGVSVAPPPGAFLQASAAAEVAITAAVLAGLPDKFTGKARIVELFAGCGTLTFALAERARTVAYEGDRGAYEALRKAVAGRRIDAVQRDLARQPLASKELAGAAAIVLDPPFPGAAAQMAGIAGSGAARVIYVSCNPGALARDAKALHQAGYRVVSATPVDQFLWSAQVESVVVFARR
jgi:23S rRNA (uracil1939-C5)-methyltransferase